MLYDKLDRCFWNDGGNIYKKIEESSAETKWEKWCLYPTFAQQQECILSRGDLWERAHAVTDNILIKLEYGKNTIAYER